MESLPGKGVLGTPGSELSITFLKISTYIRVLTRVCKYVSDQFHLRCLRKILGHFRTQIPRRLRQTKDLTCGHV